VLKTGYVHMTITIVPASYSEDFEAIWEIFQSVITAGDSYIYPESISREEATTVWFGGTTTFVAKEGGVVVGVYVIRDNKTGRGSHICNAGFMVSPNHRGKGIGRMLGLHALEEAKKLGYHAMQFNVVVSTNTVAVKLWQSIGFKILCTIPEGYRHKEKGLVDMYIMYQKL
jgi:GNAT superfamily N-acetyltransferase